MHLQPANFDFFDKNWKPIIANMPILSVSDPKELGYGERDYQKRCHVEFKDKKNTLLISPTGSGKSLIQVFNAAREIIKSDYTQKQVFIVPQLNIANGFSEHCHNKLKINNEVYGWEITVNCCYVNEQSVKRIKNFLLKKHLCKSYKANKILGGCTAVVSSSALLSNTNLQNSPN